MEQVLSIFLPAWDIELLDRRSRIPRPPDASVCRPGAPPRRPLLLACAQAQQEVVARCCGLAQSQGVLPGMPLAEARAISSRARVAAFDPDRSRQALALLARWCIRFSPRVSVDPIAAGEYPQPTPDGLLLDTTGGAHLFGGEPLLLTEVATRLRRLGFSARLAIAPTLGAAWALARFGPHPLAVVRHEQVETALAPLPIAALRISPETRHRLHEVGIEQVRHLLKLPRESLVTRFGEDLLMRLDHAFGRIDEQLEPVHPSEPLAVRQVFEGASTQLEAVFLATQQLLGELSRQLQERESGVRGLRLELSRINAAAVSREIVVGQASRDAKHLWALLRPKLESMHLGYGVEAITLTAHWTERIRHRQTGAWGTGEADDTHDQEYAGFLDTLVNRWGTQRVLSARPVASHVPEVARHFRPAREPEKERERGGEDLLFVDRPSVLFERPEAAEVLALQPDHPPSRLQWRHQDHVLRMGQGPERITTAWWRGDHGRSGPGKLSTRDYFKVQTAAGLWLWVFHELESNQWYVQGMWT